MDKSHRVLSVFVLGLLCGVSLLEAGELPAVTRTLGRPFRSPAPAQPTADAAVQSIPAPRHAETRVAPPATPADWPAAASNPATQPRRSEARSGVRLLARRVLSDAETANSVITTAEPTVTSRGPEVFVTGNYFAAFARGPRAAFSYIDPAARFGPAQGKAFCCDQVSIYAPEHDLLVWLLQYESDSQGNVLRLAVAKGEDIRRQDWHVYELTPQDVGGWTGLFFDYSNLAVGGDFLYITTNTAKPDAFRHGVILRMPLDELAAYEELSYDVFSTDEVVELRATQGATDPMHWAGHLLSSLGNTLRVFTWREEELRVTFDDVEVETFGADFKKDIQTRAPWLSIIDAAVTAAWRSGRQLGFAWTAASDPNHDFPHVRVAILDARTRKLIAEPHLWNNEFAFAYPAAAPNSSGRVGISVQYGGGRLHPSSAIGVLDPGARPLWRLLILREGTHDPADRFWGDYLSIQPDGRQRDTWVATGYTLQGGATSGFVEIIVARFRPR